MTTSSSPDNEAAGEGRLREVVRVGVRLTEDQLNLLEARGLLREDTFTGTAGFDQFVQRSIGTYLDLEQLIREGGELLLRRPGEQPRPLRLDFTPQQTAAGLPIQVSPLRAALRRMKEAMPSEDYEDEEEYEFEDEYEEAEDEEEAPEGPVMEPPLRRRRADREEP